MDFGISLSCFSVLSTRPRRARLRAAQALVLMSLENLDDSSVTLKTIYNQAKMDQSNLKDCCQYVCISFYSTETLPKKFFASSIHPGWRTLHSWIKALICDRELATEPIIWRIMSQLIRILDHLHSASWQDDHENIRVVYRDWSPSLILLDNLFCVKLLIPQKNISSESCAQDRSVATEDILKISSFIAPEVLLDQPYTEKADIYSLGTILYLLTSLSKPRLIESIDFDNKVASFTDTPITLPPIYSENIYTFMGMTLCLDPSQRASVTELLAFPSVERALADLLGTRLEDASSNEDSGLSDVNTFESNGGFFSKTRPTIDIKEFMDSITIKHPNVHVKHARLSPSSQYCPKRPIKLMPLGETDPRCDSLGHTQLMQATIANDAVVAGRFVHLAGYRNNAGLTALMLAACLGYAELTKLLAMSEAQMRTQVCVRINQWVFQEATALMFAAGFGHTGCVKHLYGREARMIEAYKHRTALMTACYFGHYSCVKILAPHEARMRDIQGKTALMYAAESNNIKCVQCLINKEAGMSMNRTNDLYSEWTALLFAVQEGNYECIKTLAPLEAHISGALSLDIITKDTSNVRNKLAPDQKSEISNLITQYMNSTIIRGRSV